MNQKGIAPIILLLAIATLVLAIGGYYWITSQPAKSIPQATTQTSPITYATSNIDTSNWKTYTNTKYGFSFKYPPTLEFNSSHDTFSLKTKSAEIISASITTNQKAFISDMLYEPCDKVLSDSYKGNSTICIDYPKDRDTKLGTVSAKRFEYIEIGYGGGGANIIQTTQVPFLQLKLGFAIDSDGNGVEIFNQILSTFKFTNSSQATLSDTELIEIKQSLSEIEKADVNKVLIDQVDSPKYPGKYISGSFHVQGVGGGAKWFAQNTNGHWSIIYTGSGLPQCSEVTKYNAPKDFLACY